MTNKEKMLNGEYYISLDEELGIERERAKDLLFEIYSVKGIGKCPCIFETPVL